MCEKVFDLHGVTEDEVKILMMAIAQEGSALNWLRRLEDKRKSCYEAFCRALAERFMAAKSQLQLTKSLIYMWKDSPQYH